MISTKIFLLALIPASLYASVPLQLPYTDLGSWTRIDGLGLMEYDINGSAWLITVSGISMGHDGSARNITVTTTGEVGPGDEIIYEALPNETFVDGDMTVHHRLLFRCSSHTWIIKGDANLLPDGCVPDERIFAKVIS